MYGYNFFHIGFQIIFYDYSQLCSHLEYLVVDFLVAKDKIPSIPGQPIITESFVDQGDPMHINFKGTHTPSYDEDECVYEYQLQHVYLSSS